MRKLLDSLTYVFSFLLLQVVTSTIVTLLFPSAGRAMTIILATVLSGGFTIALFCATGWCSRGLGYLREKPWGTVALTALLALTLLIPLTVLEEMIPEEWLPNLQEETFDMLMTSFGGYIAIALITPVVEEVVFRGGILRRLLQRGDEKPCATAKETWRAIAVSALIFSLFHMNPAQMPHAFVVGLLLGWLYSRTHSIVPGVVYHWVNNSVPFVLTWLFPDISTSTKMTEMLPGGPLGITMICVGMAILSLLLLRALHNAMGWLGK